MRHGIGMNHAQTTRLSIHSGFNYTFYLLNLNDLNDYNFKQIVVIINQFFQIS